MIRSTQTLRQKSRKDGRALMSGRRGICSKDALDAQGLMSEVDMLQACLNALQRVLSGGDHLWPVASDRTQVVKGLVVH